MRRVCVIGGGTAGVEAAREAVGAGAEVTVLEKSPSPGRPWRSWPDLIREPSTSGMAPPRRMPPDAMVLPAEAKSIDSGSVLSSGGPLTRLDAVVIATGCDFAPSLLPGHRKPGVHELCSASACAELGRSLGSTLRPVVFGEGARALEVADRMAGGERDVRVVISHWRHGEPNPEVFEVLKRAAGVRGVSVSNGRVTQAVGERHLEAVVIGGRVTCCDSLVLLPNRIPKVVPSAARLGKAGGFLVDRSLRTSSPLVFAAGGCAEICAAASLPYLFEDEPGMAGRIAGANSVGQGLAVGPVIRFETDAFGLRWTRVETRFGWIGHSQIRLGLVSRRWTPDSACAIVFDRLRGKVLRTELVEDEGASRVGSPPPSAEGESLRSLAYNGSSDISLVSDTARLALGHWSDS